MTILQEVLTLSIEFGVDDGVLKSIANRSEEELKLILQAHKRNE